MTTTDNDDDDLASKQIYADAERIADTFLAQKNHPFALVVASQMLGSAALLTLDSMGDEAPATRTEMSEAFRQVMENGTPGGIDGVHALQSFFALPDDDAGQAAAFLAFRAIIGARHDGIEALARLVSAAAIVQTFFGVTTKDDTVGARSVAISNLARQALARNDRHFAQYRMPNTNSPGGES